MPLGDISASATDQIFANESSLVGSIGVRFDSFGFDRSLIGWALKED